MKPFNLEEAKAGKPVCTRDGKPARIVCYDKKNSIYPLVALVFNENQEVTLHYTENGAYYNNEETLSDLMMAGEKKED